VKILFDANTPAPLAPPTLRRIAARIATAVDFVQTGRVVRVDVGML
jgi:hypothetical protein